jgi:replicative DNA helicase
MTDLTNLAAEHAVLGALLTTASMLDPLIVEDGLRPSHFYRDREQAIFAAMVAVHDRGGKPDAVLLAAEAGTPDAASIDALAASAAPFGTCREHARLVIDLGRRRQRESVCQAMLEANLTGDEDAYNAAEARLLALDDHRHDDGSAPERIAAETVAFLDGDEGTAAIPTPFRRLNDLSFGGLRRGDVTIIAAWTSMGKSVLVDQFLEHAADRGLRAAALINEMSRRDRNIRSIARRSGVPFSSLMSRQLDRDEMAVAREHAEPSFPIVDITGWPAVDIARHLRRHRYDIAAVDLVNRIPHDGVKGMDEVSRTLNDVALQADMHLLVVAQFNQERAKMEKRPRPVLRDIRGTSMLFNDPANVLFLHREEDFIEHPGTGERTDILEVLPDGNVWFPKIRNGELGGEKVRFQAERMRFLPREIPTFSQVAA